MKLGPAVQFHYVDGYMKLSKLGNDNKNEWDVGCSDLTNVRINKSKKVFVIIITNIIYCKFRSLLLVLK